MVLTATAAGAADLQARTARAYDAYVEDARQAFIARVRNEPPVETTHEGVLFVRPARQDGIIDVPGGLVHHWTGGAFARGVTLQQAIETSTAYSRYGSIYKPIVSARVLEHDDNTYRVLMRIQQRGGGVTAVLDVRSTIQYTFPDSRSAYSISNADEIREVQNAGESHERLMPAGRDNGYLWRASTFTYLREQSDGLYVEMQTIGLSRRFPPLLGWFIEPIARRLGRRSVETSLQEFLAALRAARPQ